MVQILDPHLSAFPSPETLSPDAAITRQSHTRDTTMTTLSAAAQNIIGHANQLPSDERRALAEAILATIPQPAPPPAAPVVEIGYSDGALTAGRPPEKLFFFSPDGSEIHQFKGQPIPKVCAVKSSTYHKNGKWSHTAYRIVVSPGFSPCCLRVELHQEGVFSACGTFAEVAARLHRSGAPANLPLRTVRAFLSVHFAAAHKRIEEAEAQIASLV